ncbi:hypothetical protein K456DRAFT_724121 [Colletotrichum gloeosporioides 23]|nr:hypothetical protein K456DRAFT_724121 [Colletotrichum gloeosporioides 23]
MMLCCAFLLVESFRVKQLDVRPHGGRFSEALSAFRPSGGSPSSHPSATLKSQLNGVRRIGCVPCCLGQRWRDWMRGCAGVCKLPGASRDLRLGLLKRQSVLPDWTERSRCAASDIVACGFDDDLRLDCFSYALLWLLNITALIVEGCRGKVGGRLPFVKSNASDAADTRSQRYLTNKDHPNITWTWAD